MRFFSFIQKEYRVYRTLLALFFLIAVPSAALAAASGDELTTTVQWKMSLDAGGHVTSLEPKSKTIDAVREKLEPVVRGWEFEPGTVNGQPSATDTLLSVQIALLPSADGKSYGVRLDDVRTGGYVSGTATPPAFPASEARKLMDNGKFARLILEVSYDASGKATSVDLATGSTVSKGRLVELAKEAVSSWSYQPELVAGIGVAGSVMVPICYTVSSSRQQAEHDAQKCQWTQPGSKATVAEGESLALESSVHLKSDVIGSTL
jgi:hypothetical protein